MWATLALFFALHPAALESQGFGAKIKEKAAEVAAEAVVPSRGAPAAWCGRTGCKTGVAGSVIRRPSKVFPRRYWTLDLFLGDDEGGAAFAWEVLPHEAGNLRLFAGVGFAMELDSDAIEEAVAAPVVYVTARF